jgi:hypothetical protein
MLLDMDIEQEEILEEVWLKEKAKGLLRFVITGKGDYPHPINEAETCAKAIQYSINKGYVLKQNDSKYIITEEGKKYALD